MDPDAKFAWVFRHPVGTVQSLIACERFYVDAPQYRMVDGDIVMDVASSDHFGMMLLKPRDGWSGNLSQVGKCTWAWMLTNRLIMEQLSGRDFAMYHCDDLPVRFNAAETLNMEPKPLLYLTPDDAAIMKKGAIPLYERLCSLLNEHRGNDCQSPKTMDDVREFWKPETMEAI